LESRVKKRERFRGGVKKKMEKALGKKKGVKPFFSRNKKQEFKRGVYGFSCNTSTGGGGGGWGGINYLKTELEFSLNKNWGFGQRTASGRVRA